MFKKKFAGQGRTIGDGPKPPPAPTVRPKADLSVANVKFEFRFRDTVHRRDAQFQISQSLAELYNWLEANVFATVDGLEVVQAFPRAVIPRDPSRALASMQIKGQVLLQVNFTRAVLRS
jgi:hypothetical protein